jgi:hypothetical protein
MAFSFESFATGFIAVFNCLRYAVGARHLDMSCPYSEAFLTVLSKFGREICVITEQRFKHILLKFFAPSQTIRRCDGMDTGDGSGGISDVLTLLWAIKFVLLVQLACRLQSHHNALQKTDPLCNQIKLG